MRSPVHVTQGHCQRARAARFDETWLVWQEQQRFIHAFLLSDFPVCSRSGIITGAQSITRWTRNDPDLQARAGFLPRLAAADVGCLCWSSLLRFHADSLINAYESAARSHRRNWFPEGEPPLPRWRLSSSRDEPLLPCIEPLSAKTGHLDERIFMCRRAYPEVLPVIVIRFRYSP